MKITGFIPARYESTRFPGKPLIDIAGQSMIRRVYERARQAKSLHEVYVLTDDDRIADHVKSFGGKVVLTSRDCPTGTARILEALSLVPGVEACINIQGDEPFISPDQIDLVARPMQQHTGAFVSTLIHRITDPEEIERPSVVKVVVQQDGTALYFSRSPVPYMRDKDQTRDWLQSHSYWKHIGIYGYTAAALELIRNMKPGALETAEKLEQLTWLENGLTIRTAVTTEQTIAVDTKEDLARLLAWMKSNGIS